MTRMRRLDVTSVRKKLRDKDISIILEKEF